MAKKEKMNQEAKERDEREDDMKIDQQLDDLERKFIGQGS